MKKVKRTLSIVGTLIFLFSFGNISWTNVNSGRSYSDQTTLKSTQTNSKTTQAVTKSKTATTKTTQTVAKPKTVSSKTTQTVAKPKTAGTKPAAVKPVQPSAKPAVKMKSADAGIVTIGQQNWAVANLNVSTFRNGDSIPEAKTNQEWVVAGEAGKAAWCYYNNDPAMGKKYGKLYNWYAVNDPRELAPDGWRLSSAEDWAELAYYQGGAAIAGTKIKSISGWLEGNNGTDESGFNGLPGGYRIENGVFMNNGSAGTWWSSTEGKTHTAIDHYLYFSRSLGSSSNPKQRGESVRCLKE